MRVTSLSALPPLLPEFVLDVETTSWNPKEPSFNPFQGHRIAGIAYGPLAGDATWYLPVRHHSSADCENLDLAAVQRWLADLFQQAKLYCNHNLLFDLSFLSFDGVSVVDSAVSLEDTMVLARLVHNDLPTYSLAYLGAVFKCGQVKQGDPVKAYLKSERTKDFGECPIGLMADYAEQDVRATAELYHALKRELPESAQPVWDVERVTTKELLRATLEGVEVDHRIMAETECNGLRHLIEANEEVNKLAGHEVDPGRDADLDSLLIGELGIKPTVFTSTGKPSWTKVVFEQMQHPVGKWLTQWSNYERLVNTYCVGWKKRIGEDGRLHPRYKQAGTRTGRLSCEDPNFQNIPPEAEVFVLAGEGRALVAFDYSQIEYRIFGHYTQDPRVLTAYTTNKDADFHQLLADMLGVPRQFAKSCNFGFIYGMGKNKLVSMIAGLLAIAADDTTMMERMRTYLTGGARTTADRAASVLNAAEYTAVGEKVYNDYHAKVPAIRTFTNAVSAAAKRRGWVRNLFGRVYRTSHASAHKSVNWLIQGSAADLFKQRVFVALLPEARRRFDAKMVGNVHDSIFMSVPTAAAQEYYDFAVPVLEDYPLRVPVLVSGKASARSWGQVAKVVNGDVGAALRESETRTQRQWNV